MQKMYKYCEKSLENVYLLLISTFILLMLSGSTTFNIVFPEHFETMLRVMMCVVVLAKILYCENKKASDVILFSIVMVVFFLAWWSTRYSFLLNLPLIMFGAFNIPYKKILKTGFWTMFYVLAVSMLGVFLGEIRDLVFVDGANLKHSFGITYPTDFAALVFYLAVFAWVLYSDVSALWITLLSILLAWFVYRYAGARNSAGMLCIAAVGMAYVALRSSVWFVKIKWLDKLCRRIERLLVFTMPAAAIVMVTLTMVYDPNKAWLNKLDLLSHNRLIWGRNVFDTYGLKCFGTPFSLVGLGGRPGYLRRIEGYNFVDCSYALIAVRYGLVTLIILCVLAVICSQKALKNGQIKLVIALMLIAGHCILEHHYIEINYNLFLLLPFADFRDNASLEKNSVKKKIGFNLYAVGIGLIGAFCFSTFVMFARTVVSVLSKNVGQRQFLFLVCMAVILWSMYRLIHGVWHIVCRLIGHDVVAKSLWHKLLCYGMVMGMFLITGIIAVRYGTKVYADTLEEERVMLQALAECEELEGIYIDDVPLLYWGRFEKIAFSPFRQEGLTDKKNVVLLTTKEKKQTILLNRGFQCLTSLKKHDIYTNSETSMEILLEQGLGD